MSKPAHAGKPGEAIPRTGIYWCSVCKFPVILQQGQNFPECRNKCGRSRWEFVRGLKEPEHPPAGDLGDDS